MGYNTILQYCSQIYRHPRILPTSATGSHNITHSTQDKRLERFFEPNVHKGLKGIKFATLALLSPKDHPLKTEITFRSQNTVRF